MTHKKNYFWPTPKPKTSNVPKKPPSCQLEGRKRTRSVSSESDVGESDLDESNDPKERGLDSDEDEQHFAPAESEFEDTENNDVASDEGDGTIGPIKQELHQKYLAEAKRNQDLLDELSRLPEDILDQVHIKQLKSHKTVKVDGTTNVHFITKTAEGFEINCNLDDLKVDAPLTLARYIMDKPGLKRQKPLERWALKTIKPTDRISQLAACLERRAGVQPIIQGDVASVSSRRCTLCKIRRTKKPGQNTRKSNPMGRFK